MNVICDFEMFDYDEEEAVCDFNEGEYNMFDSKAPVMPRSVDYMDLYGIPPGYFK